MAPSPLFAYFTSSSLVGLGVFGLSQPIQAYEAFRLPLATPPAFSSAKAEKKTHPAAHAGPSPFLYAKAARDLSNGIAFIAL